MPIEDVANFSDPRVALYQNLKDHELDRAGQYFIAEGEHLPRRLLDSDFHVESILMADQRVEELATLVKDRAPSYGLSARGPASASTARCAMAAGRRIIFQS